MYESRKEKFIKEQETREFLSSLRIKTPSSEIPLSGSSFSI